MNDPLNPYQSPADLSGSDSATSADLGDAERKLVHYAGGKRGIAWVCIAGAILILGMFSGFGFVRAVGPIFPVFTVWMSTTIAMMFLLRGIELHFTIRLISGFGLGVIASIIYVPVCVSTVLFSDEAIPADLGMYWVILFSIGLFVAMTIALAAIVRASFQRKENKRAGR